MKNTVTNWNYSLCTVHGISPSQCKCSFPSFAFISNKKRIDRFSEEAASVITLSLTVEGRSL